MTRQLVGALKRPGVITPTWMEQILSSRTSEVLLNGAPGKTIHCRRVVRQGDPLSPLLFVLVANFLQSIVNKAKDMGILNLPIPLSSNRDFRILQYANDTLIILEGNVNKLLFLKALLNSFSASTRLKINFQKSMMVSINISEQKLDHLAKTFSCDKGSLPLTYSELPLGITKPKVEGFLPMVNRW